MGDQGGQSSELKIPTDTQEKFPELIDLIKKSQSMDAEERQYWVDAMPVMTDDQLKNLRNILESEQKQIAKAEKEHQKNMNAIEKKVQVDFNSFQYKEKKRLIKEAEAKESNKEKEGLRGLLDEIQKL